jgi:hypothetical protein
MADQPSINDFIKAMQREFGEGIGYRATRLSDGLVIEKNYPQVNETGIWTTPMPSLKPLEKGKRK